MTYRLQGMATASQTSSISSSMMVPFIPSCLTPSSQNMLSYWTCFLSFMLPWPWMILPVPQSSSQTWRPSNCIFQTSAQSLPPLESVPCSRRQTWVLLLCSWNTTSTSLVRPLFYWIVLIGMFVFQLENSFFKVKHMFCLCISRLEESLAQNWYSMTESPTLLYLTTYYITALNFSRYQWLKNICYWTYLFHPKYFKAKLTKQKNRDLKPTLALSLNNVLHTIKPSWSNSESIN